MIILWVNFDHFWFERHFFDAAGALVKICTSLNQPQKGKFSLFKSMKHYVRMCAWKSMFLKENS